MSASSTRVPGSMWSGLKMPLAVVDLDVAAGEAHGDGAERVGSLAGFDEK